MASRDLLLSFFRHALREADPATLVRHALTINENTLSIGDQTFDLDPYDKIYLFGSGKAAVPMGKALLEVMGNRITGGYLIAPETAQLSKIDVLVADHPIPTERSAAAAQTLYDSISGLGEKSFFIYLLSGGSSALMELPAPPLTIEELNQTNRILLENALPIESINAIRKHLSRVKGGQLALATKAKGIVLVLSDVIGDSLEVIGSAPLYCDPSTFTDAMQLLETKNLLSQLPANVLERLKQGAAGKLPETPKSPSKNLAHFLIGSNRIALESVLKAAHAAGIESTIVTDRLSGEASQIARDLIKDAKKIQEQNQNLPRLLIYGGEPTVTVTGNGKGGRNQELTLAALAELKEHPGITLLSGGTDGIDGNSDAAGAVVDAQAYAKSRDLGFDLNRYLADNDSYHAHQKLETLIVTGYTGTNVMDIILVMIEPPPN